MKFFGQLFAFFLIVASFCIFLLIVYFGWFTAIAVFNGAKTLKPEIYVPLAVTVVTAVIGLAATLYMQTRARKREIEAAFRERKIAIYLDFLETFAKLFLADKPDLELAPMTTNEVVLKLVEVRTKSVLWGSTGVLQALNAMTKAGEDNTLVMAGILDKLQREMRKDLGLSNFGLEEDFFTKLILTSDEECLQLKSGKVS